MVKRGHVCEGCDGHWVSLGQDGHEDDATNIQFLGRTTFEKGSKAAMELSFTTHPHQRAEVDAVVRHRRLAGDSTSKWSSDVGFHNISSVLH